MLTASQPIAANDKSLDMSSKPLEIRAYRSLDELQAIRVPWKELLSDYPLATTFSTPEWLMCWWRNFGARQELLVAGFYADSRLVALAPLSLTKFRAGRVISLWQLRLMGDSSHDSDNLDLLVRPGFEESFATSLLHFLERARGRWDFAQLNTLPERSPAAHALGQLLRRRKWVVTSNRSPASAIALPGTWGEYLQSISSKERGKITYYSKRLENKYQARFYRCENEDKLPQCLDALFDLHQKRWQSAGQPGSFASAERRQFYLDLGRELLARNLLEFWLVDLNGTPAAAQFGFRFGTTVSQLQEGFDRQYARDSVGYVLRARVIRELIAQGVRTYDFLGGSDESKQRWGAQAGHYLNLSFARPLTAGAAFLQTQQSAAQSKEWLRRNLPASAWKILRGIKVGVRGKEKGALISPQGAQRKTKESAQDKAS